MGGSAAAADRDAVNIMARAASSQFRDLVCVLRPEESEARQRHGTSGSIS